MTNAEKYEEVFGMKVDPTSCPTESCPDCPCREKDSNGRIISCSPGKMYDWWHKEYKGTTISCKDCDGYEAGYSAGLRDAEKR